MDISSFGGLIPLWILGAPFLGALVHLFTLPRTAVRHDRDRANRPAAAPMPATGAGTPGTPGTSTRRW